MKKSLLRCRWRGSLNRDLPRFDARAQVIDCVSYRDCVAPDGADQSNHRFDQSVFSIVLSRLHIRCHNNWKFNGYLEEDRLHEVLAAARAAASPSIMLSG